MARFKHRDEPTHRSAVRRAVEVCGSQRELARRLAADTSQPIAQAHVWGWLNRTSRFPPELCAPFERVTGGLISKFDLRPDLYPRDSGAA